MCYARDIDLNAEMVRQGCRVATTNNNWGKAVMSDDAGEGPVVKEISEVKFSIEGQEGVYQRALCGLTLYVREISLGYSRGLGYKPEQGLGYPRLSGEAVISGGGLTIAGNEDARTNTLYFHIECEDDPAFQANREDILRMHALAETPFPFELKETLKEYTASLWFSPADWEIGTRDQYGCGFALKKPEFDYLVENIREGRLNNLHVRLELWGMYVRSGDEHAPPAEAITWYFKPSKHGPQVFGTFGSIHASEKTVCFDLTEYQRDSVRWVKQGDEPSDVDVPDMGDDKFDSGKTRIENLEEEQTHLLEIIYENTKTRSHSWMTAGIWIAIGLSLIAILKS